MCHNMLLLELHNIFQGHVARFLDWFTNAMLVLHNYHPMFTAFSETGSGRGYMMQDHADSLRNAAIDRLQYKALECWAHAAKAIHAKIVSFFEESSVAQVYSDLRALHNRTVDSHFKFQLSLFYKKYSHVPLFVDYLKKTYDCSGKRATWHLGNSQILSCQIFRETHQTVLVFQVPHRLACRARTTAWKAEMHESRGRRGHAV